MKKQIFLGFLTAAAIGSSALGQSSQAPIKGMASTVGLYVYPKAGQAQSKQLTDESQCYSNAKTQTGYDPNAAAPASASGSPGEKSNDHEVGKSAARGAAISGATGGDAAAGARRGAMIGKIKEKRQENQQAAAASKQTDVTKSQQQQNQDNFKRSLSACLEARNYSVQ